MKYENYEITQPSEHEWKVVRRDPAKAAHDITNAKTGKVVRKKGEMYEKETLIGYYSCVGSALTGVVKNMAGKGCETIRELADQIKKIRRDLDVLTSAKEVV